MKARLLIVLAVTSTAACGGLTESDDASRAAVRSTLSAVATFTNENGAATTVDVNGVIDTTPSNPFFRSMGTNGRTCGSCHQPAENWSITPKGVQKRFHQTQGLDPIFRTNDGSNSPNADVSSLKARTEAYSMLLTKGLIRIGIGVPPGGELELVAVDDPYHFASATELSLFRRPLPTTNLTFLTATMWDGRESTPIADALLGPNDTIGDLSTQANTATMTHAEAATPVPAAVRAEIVAFELGLFTAQSKDKGAGSLSDGGASGGPTALSTQLFYFGINDVVAGDARTGAPFTPLGMNVFDAWSSLKGAEGHAREAIARGQAIFNTTPIAITGVRGVNDVLGIPTLNGTCTTCHDSPNVGHHSVRLPLDLGLTDASRRTPDMPLYTLCKRQVGANGAPIPGTCDPTEARIQTTDPGRALISGKWADVATFKGPILRALSGRAPYFHNGSAPTLEAVVDFYDSRFGIGFSTQQKSDLAVFLAAL